MQTVFSWLGLIGFWILGLALLLNGLGYAFDAYHAFWERTMKEANEHALRREGQMLYNEAYWMSEDKSAMVLARLLGKSLRDNGRIDISRVRDEWRKTMQNDENVKAVMHND